MVRILRINRRPVPDMDQTMNSLVLLTKSCVALLKATYGASARQLEENTTAGCHRGSLDIVSANTAAAGTIQASTLQENPAAETQQPSHCRPLPGFEQSEGAHRSFLISCHCRGYLRGIPPGSNTSASRPSTTAAAEQTASASSERGVPPKHAPRSDGPHVVGDLSPNECAAPIVFRPIGQKANFLAVSRDAIAAILSGFPATKRVRVNFWRNLVAVDTHATTNLTTLLEVGMICETKV
ncbi:hypothetical protein HPB51_022728 [Rhipicephalus microplus]|uniref:Uncharacterized protein n=1 Tax=Rhipicephalus microplus TaxID=6941 RepID=A0A9J6EIP8_RHIMP|nr:hypothetical protein HPB51_022728 [Rhipicephalus microplus]